MTATVTTTANAATPVIAPAALTDGLCPSSSRTLGRETNDCVSDRDAKDDRDERDHRENGTNGDDRKGMLSHRVSHDGQADSDPVIAIDSPPPAHDDLDVAAE